MSISIYTLRHQVRSGFTALVTLFLTSACNQVPRAEAQMPPSVKGPEPQTVQKVVINGTDTLRMDFVNYNSIVLEGWDSLAQPKFWKQIMCLSPDSCIINVARSRTPLQVACYRTWCTQSEMEKTILKNRLREENELNYGDELFVTNGKREFYEHRKSIPTIAKAVQYFREYGVDPWYAQTILLIESPGKHLSKSYVGAAGPFQLMRSVALNYGLKVNKYVDERADLRRASYGASKLISSICIPKVKGMLDSRNIPYKETDTWFRLLVLHAYHAGAGNLACAMNKINPAAGGQELIRTLWKTEAGGFRNESQNYSQIALAATLNFSEILQQDGDSVFMVLGDRDYARLQRKPASLQDPSCIDHVLEMYERDLADGTIDFITFEEKIQLLKPTWNNPAAPYPADDRQWVRLAGELIKKRKMEEAIRLLRMNMDSHPASSVTAEQLGRAYRIKGQAGLAQKYMTKSSELVRSGQ